jgi:hypothetical protein
MLKAFCSMTLMILSLAIFNFTALASDEQEKEQTFSSRSFLKNELKELPHESLEELYTGTYKPTVISRNIGFISSLVGIYYVGRAYGRGSWASFFKGTPFLYAGNSLLNAYHRQYPVTIAIEEAYQISDMLHNMELDD